MTLPEQTKTKRRLAFLFSIPLAFSIVFFGVDVAAEHTDIELMKIRTVYSSVTELRMLARDAESGERGFLLTGKDRYLMPFQQGSLLLESQVTNALKAAAERPEVEPDVKKLADLVRKRFDQADELLKLQKAKGFLAAQYSLKSDGSETTMDDIRAVTKVIQAKLDKENASYDRREKTLYARTFAFYAASTLIIIGVLAWLYNELVSYLHARDAALAELGALNADLEARITDRTRDLTHANEELQQFAYVASHDLQEPLRTITSFSQLLETRYQGRLDEDAHEFIGYVVASARRMTDLINGLLALVRLRKTGQPVEPVSFEKLFEDAEISLQAAIRENDVEIRHGSLPALVVDQVQFSQVLQNLISNAIKYRREERPSIWIEAHRDSSNWVFSVRDNGRGFDQEFAERIFGLFQRLHSGSVEGTGMGLSIARRIVERHGGRIWAESKEGVGSTFYFSLPISLESRHQKSSKEKESLAVKVS